MGGQLEREVIINQSFQMVKKTSCRPSHGSGDDKNETLSLHESVRISHVDLRGMCCRVHHPGTDGLDAHDKNWRSED